MPSRTSLSALLAGFRPRMVDGISAVLLPYEESGAVDWPAFERHLRRTTDAGLAPAVNMDTGFGDLLSPEERIGVLEFVAGVLEGRRFVAGAYPGAFDPVTGWRRSIAAIESRGGTPILIQSKALQESGAAEVAAAYRAAVEGSGGCLAFELGPVFASHGAIWDQETFRRILDLPELLGAKHSSLSRTTELSRLALRDAQRPEFRIYTGNDLAIDMVLYGSDWLLGLSTCAPELFATRDAYLAADDVRALEIRDALQYLGALVFREPVPAYKHSAAVFLHMGGEGIPPHVHPRALHRAAGEEEVLRDSFRRVEALRPEPGPEAA